MIKEEIEREKKAEKNLLDNMAVEKEKGEGLERELERKERVEDLLLEEKSDAQKVAELDALQQAD